MSSDESIHKARAARESRTSSSGVIFVDDLGQAKAKTFPNRVHKNMIPPRTRRSAQEMRQLRKEMAARAQDAMDTALRAIKAKLPVDDHLAADSYLAADSHGPGTLNACFRDATPPACLSSFLAFDQSPIYWSPEAIKELFLWTTSMQGNIPLNAPYTCQTISQTHGINFGFGSQQQQPDINTWPNTDTMWSSMQQPCPTTLNWASVPNLASGIMPGHVCGHCLSRQRLTVRERFVMSWIQHSLKGGRNTRYVFT